MFETEIEEKQSFETILSHMYGNVGDWSGAWRNRAYFSETGIARLASIAGHITGLAQAGQKEFAIRLANDFYRNMNTLCMVEHNVEFSGHYVPARKVLLGDDRCFHSFGFMAVRAIDPAEYEKKFQKYVRELEQDPLYANEPKIVRDTAKRKAFEELHVVERSSGDLYAGGLTEHRWRDGKETVVYYGHSWHGGLIYHGPGAGETFSVCVGNKPLWALHS